MEFLQHNWYWRRSPPPRLPADGRTRPQPAATDTSSRPWRRPSSSTARTRSSSTCASRASTPRPHPQRAPHPRRRDRAPRQGDGKVEGPPVILCCTTGARSNSAAGCRKAGFNPHLQPARRHDGVAEGGQPVSRKEVSMQPPIRMYATATCPYCIRAEQLLLDKGRGRAGQDPRRSRPLASRDG